MGIHKVRCKDSNLIYIGQNKRNLETRLSEHLRCVNNQESYKTSIAKQWLGTGNNFNFHQAKIIFKPNRNSELDFFENIAIPLNRDVIVNEKKNDCITLSTAWETYSVLIITLV